MYNWDDPINEALSKPEPKIEKNVKETMPLEDISPKNNSISQPNTEDNQEGLTGIENIEKGAGY